MTEEFAVGLSIGRLLGCGVMYFYFYKSKLIRTSTEYYAAMAKGE